MGARPKEAASASKSLASWVARNRAEDHAAHLEEDDLRILVDRLPSQAVDIEAS
jgi:hypothetical protein